MSDNTQYLIPNTENGEVAGVTTQKGKYLEKMKPVNFSIEPNQFVRVRGKPEIS